ncbi:MAG: transglutaminase domain-containing protein [Bdellovibrio sp.]
MKHFALRFKLILLVVSFFLTSVGLSAPSDTSSFVIQQGGFVDLYDGAYVQGSKSFGGIQPDYRIDLTDPDLVKFIKQIKRAVALSYKIHLLNAIGKKDAARTKTIELVAALVHEALPLGQYDSAPYLEVLKEHRLKDIDISLGSYLRCGAGVCRENALITHVALKAVGIENKYVYAFVQQGQRAEDHAIVVVQDQSGRWIVDPYNSNFHGRNFDDILLEGGHEKAIPRLAPFAKTTTTIARIVRVNNYPTYWVPKKYFKNLCTAVFF